MQGRIVLLDICDIRLLPTIQPSEQIGRMQCVGRISIASLIYINLHTSLHYAVGKICNENAAGLKVKFSKEFIATLADVTYRQAGIIAEDLEAFSKHAKRTTINADDIKLLVRRSKSLHEHISKMAEELSASSVKVKAKKKKIEMGEPSHTIDLE